MSENEITVYDKRDYLLPAEQMDMLISHIGNVFNITPRPNTADRSQLVHAAQAAAMFNLLPNKGLWVYSAYKNGPLIVDIGLEAYQQSARRYELESGRRLYFGTTEILTEDQVKAVLAGDPRLHEGIVGVAVPVVFDDEYREMGQMAVKKFYGFWWNERKQEKISQGKHVGWSPDTLQVNESPIQKAERRAYRKAYTRMVGLRPPERTVQQAHDRMISVSKEVEAMVNPPAGQLEQTKHIHREENGDILFPDDGEWRPADEIEVDDAPDATIESEPDPTDEEAPESKLINSITDWCRGKAQSGQVASDASYRYLSGLIDNLTGDRHGPVLTYLCGFEVTGTDKPGQEVTSKLIDMLCETTPQKDENGKKVKGPDGKVVYVENPGYRADVAQALTELAADIKKLSVLVPA